MQWFQYHLYTKCSHLYNNLESFHLLFFFFFPALLSASPYQPVRQQQPLCQFMTGNKIKRASSSSPSAPHPVLLQTDITGIAASQRRQARRQTRIPTCCCWWLGAAGGRGAFMAQVGLGKKKERKKKNRTALGDSWGCQVCFFFFFF